MLTLNPLISPFSLVLNSKFARLGFPSRVIGSVKSKVNVHFEVVEPIADLFRKEAYNHFCCLKVVRPYAEF